jgi:hypothetical protein
MEKKIEILSVKNLGEVIGYGQLMCLASALWRESLKEKGYPIMGAFVPTIRDFIEDPETLEMIDRDIIFYDKYIKGK